MYRYHLQRALSGARLSKFEEHSLAGGFILVLVAAVVAVATGDAGGVARALGLAGLAGTAAYAASRAVRLYAMGSPAALPASVARVRVRTRPPRAFTALTVALALVLPIAGGVAALVLFDWAWLVVAGLYVVGRCALAIANLLAAGGERDYVWPTTAATAGVLERLCMLADLPVPELVVEGSSVASAWSTGGRIHVTTAAIKLLDDRELEAVLAHEVAHLAHRDAAVMEICSAPSRTLIAFAGALARVGYGAAVVAVRGVPGVWVATVLAVVCTPPAFAIGWLSRLSVLGLSRAREFSADAAAAALTGRPSALASALMKLERQREWAPVADLRQAEAFATLAIIGTGRSRLGRLFSTHPPTAARVRRLEAAESRIHAGTPLRDVAV